ncbi:MAG: hypothetical protein V8T87_06900 [Victivallales bacterium]
MNSGRRELVYLESLRGDYSNYPARIADINLARAISLHTRSTLNLLIFYSLREEMFFEHKDTGGLRGILAQDEIRNSRSTKQLCEQDSCCTSTPKRLSVFSGKTGGASLPCWNKASRCGFSEIQDGCSVHCGIYGRESGLCKVRSAEELRPNMGEGGGTG